MGILGAIGHAAFGVGKAVAGGVGTAAYYAGKGAFKAGAAAAKGVGYLAKDAYAARNEIGARNAFGQFVSHGKAMAKGMGDWQKAKDVYDPLTGKVKHTDAHFKLGTFGKAALFGPAAMAGIAGGAQKYKDNRVGPVDSQVVTATPNYEPAKTPSYANNCGATGDLVFALHNNR